MRSKPSVRGAPIRGVQPRPAVNRHLRRSRSARKCRSPGPASPSFAAVGRGPNRLDLGKLAVEIRLQRPNALGQRRVRGEEIEERPGEGVAEEHVADFRGVGVADPRALGQVRRSSSAPRRFRPDCA